MFKKLWQAIKRLFIQEPFEPKIPEPLPDMPKVALVRGHEWGKPGANSHNGMSEYDYYGTVLPRVVRETQNTQEFLRDGTNIRGAIRNAKEWGADIIIEFHFNAYNSKVAGAEALICSESQREIAKDLLASWLIFANKSNRGVKKIDSGQAGYASVNEMIPVRGCLFEPFFGDNPKDYVKPSIMVDFLKGWINEIQAR